MYSVHITILCCIVLAGNAQLQSMNNKGSSDTKIKTSSTFIRYKDSTAALPINAKNIGTIDDETMKRFKSVSSHGRDDVFDVEDDDSDSIYYKFKLLLRTLWHLWNFSPVFLTLFLAYLSTSFRKSIWYGLIRYALGKGGAAFIKWGQWSSTRPDIFPEELCEALAKLQADAPEHSFSYTRKSIKAELGESIEDIFDYFSEKPIASGSIAQIYRAILRGKEVAVKVRHPNVYEQIKLDFTIMKALANFLDKIPGLHWLNLPESTSQFSGTIASQTKLDVEGRHLVLFNRFFHSWKRAKFPLPVMFTDAILIESYEHGESVTEFAKRLAKQNAWNEKISEDDMKLAHFVVTIGEDIYLKMLIQDNLMHADLHPGNILIQHSINGIPLSKSDHTNIVNGPKHDKIQTKVVLVDAGMVACLTTDERSNFIGMLEAVGDGDGDRAAEYILKFSSKRHYTYETISKFKYDTRVMFSNVCRGYGTNVQMGDVLRGILTLVRIHQVTIDANYATLFLNVLCLDGLAQSLLPSYNVLDGAMNLLKFHKFSRHVRVPFIHETLIQIGLPIARWMKKNFDESFLNDLAKKIKSSVTKR